jgi:hypothetical protein
MNGRQKTTHTPYGPELLKQGASIFDLLRTDTRWAGRRRSGASGLARSSQFETAPPELPVGWEYLSPGGPVLSWDKSPGLRLPSDEAGSVLAEDSRIEPENSRFSARESSAALKGDPAPAPEHMEPIEAEVIFPSAADDRAPENETVSAARQSPLLGDVEEIVSGRTQPASGGELNSLEHKLLTELARQTSAVQREKERPGMAAPSGTGEAVRPGALTSAAIHFGVPSGQITDPFYRNLDEKKRLTGRESGRSQHLGIDVSTSNTRGGGAEDARRGLPVYAALRPEIPLDELNRVAVHIDSNTLQSGLGLQGTGLARLDHAKVLLQPWRSQEDGAYGGVAGLACRYHYQKLDGSPGTFTLYVEFLHLITPEFLPKTGGGTLITAEKWQATGKGIGFGPQMTINAVLSAADLAATPPPLIGYLGATQFPHLHVQAAFAEGEHGYLRRPRLDPVVVLQTDRAVSPAAEEQSRLDPWEVTYNVTHGRDYGPHWQQQKPPGLPDWARLTSTAGAARSFIERTAQAQELGETFLELVLHLAQTESGQMFARPANNFDARPPEERQGRDLVTAWGVFQFNRDAWTALIPAGEHSSKPSHVPQGTSGCSAAPGCVYPWDSTPYEEILLPIQKYAQIYQAITSTGGSALDAARGVRLWQRSPHGTYPQYVENGRQQGFAAAWQAVNAADRELVDQHLRAANILQ